MSFLKEACISNMPNPDPVNGFEYKIRLGRGGARPQVQVVQATVRMRFRSVDAGRHREGWKAVQAATGRMPRRCPSGCSEGCRARVYVPAGRGPDNVPEDPVFVLTGCGDGPQVRE